jgi:hypothetical protein
MMLSDPIPTATGPDEYRGFTIDPAFHSPFWQAHIYPTFVGQVLPPIGRMPQSATCDEAIANAKQRVDAFLDGISHG